MNECHVGLLDCNSNNFFTVDESDYPESAIPPPAAHTRHLPGAGESGFKAGTVGPRRVLHSAAGPSGAFNRPTTVGMIFSLQAPKPPTL